MSAIRAAVVAAAVLSTACHGNRVEETDRESFRYDAADVRTIDVMVDAGRIEVRRGGGTSVEVVVTKRARGLDREHAGNLLEDMRVLAEESDGSIRISAVDSGVASVTADVRADVELLVPADAPQLELRTYDGRIEIHDVAGSIAASTDDGRIRASGTSGRLRLRTHDGSIRVTDVVGVVDVGTDDGRIELTGSFDGLRAVTSDGRIRVRGLNETPPAADWTLRTMDGSIDLSLPAGMAAELEVSANDGRVEIDHSGFSGRVSEQRAKGTLGRGGPFIVVTAMEGRVTVDES